MNYYIVLAVAIIVILFYILYRYFSGAGTPIKTNADLNGGITTVPLNDKSSRFTYSCWVYVNTWNSANPAVLFSRDNFKVYFDKTSPTLNVDIPISSNTVQTITMTNNFPVQSWCYICVSVDGTFVDCYINGKLVKSSTLTNNPYQPTSMVLSIGGVIKSTTSNGVTVNTVSSDKSDIYVKGVYYWNTPLNPQQIWNNYINSNGNNSLYGWFSSYGFGVTLFKDNLQFSNLRIV